MQTILVPLDGSPLAQQALPHALARARVDDAQLLLLGVDEQFVYFTETAHLTTCLSGLCERLRSAGWQARWQVLPGAPAETIVQRAREEGCELIVMTSHGRRGLTRWVLGSVTDRVAREATCPLLVIRCPQGVTPGQAEAALGQAVAGQLPSYPRVLAPLDGTQAAEAALAHVGPLVGQHLELIEVLDFPTPLYSGELPSGWAATVGRDCEEARYRYLEGVADRLRGQGLEVGVRVRRGSAAELLVEEAANFDLLVMTRCSRTWLERLVTGSVAARVLHHSPCPLLLIPGVGAPALAA